MTREISVLNAIWVELAIIIMILCSVYNDMEQIVTNLASIFLVLSAMLAAFSPWLGKLYDQ